MKAKRLLALLMAVVMVFSVSVNGVYAVAGEDNSITVERLDPSDVSANLLQGGSKLEESSRDAYYAETDIVRVMIVLEEDPALSLMHGVDDTYAGEGAVAEQREYLLEMQHTMADTISAAALDGEPLDVQWNLTLVTNAISANVAYGKIDAIAAVTLGQKHIRKTFYTASLCYA